MGDRGSSYEGVPLPDRGKPAGGGERRVALVIGNSAYPAGPLRNPRNDAEAFAAKLREMQPAFEVSVALDVGRDAMEDALEAFEAKLGDCDTALLFFAGHGLQVKGINFLMPVDADIRQEIHLRRRAFSLNEVLDIMGRRVRTSSLVFLDACRDNPFARSLLAGVPDHERGRFLTRSGLAEVRAATGSFIAFATAPDNLAQDGSGRNSPFTEALLAHMATPGVSINDMMIAVRRDVLKATGGRQEPWDQSSLRQRFCFNEAVEPPIVETVAVESSPPPPQAATPAFAFSDTALFEAAALEHWDAVKGTSDPARLREFLADYGTSRMGRLAREALERIAATAWQKVNRRDEAALALYIEAYAGTSKIAEARALLAKRNTAETADPRQEQQRADMPPRFASAPWWSWLWLIGSALGVLITVMVFEVSGWKLVSASDVNPYPTWSGILVGSLAALASAIGLATWRRGSWTGAELGVYWLGGAAASVIFIGSIGFFSGWKAVLFTDFPPRHSAALHGLLLGCFLALLSALWMALSRRLSCSGPELATYWLGGALAGVVCATLTFGGTGTVLGSGWVLPGPDASLATGSAVGSAIAVLVAIVLAVWRGSAKTNAEVVIYGFGAIVGIVLMTLEPAVLAVFAIAVLMVLLWRRRLRAQ